MLGFRVLGFRLLGFRVSGFRVLGFRVFPGAMARRRAGSAAKGPC